MPLALKEQSDKLCYVSNKYKMELFAGCVANSCLLFFSIKFIAETREYSDIWQNKLQQDNKHEQSDDQTGGNLS